MAKLERAITEFRDAWYALPEDRRNQVVESLREARNAIKFVVSFTSPAVRSAAGNLALMIAKEEFSPFGMGGENAIALVFKRLGITEKEVEKCLSS